LELSSRAENVPVVRQALNGLADAIGLAAADLNDISTAVTEACNNASAHAYGGGEGPLEVELAAGETTTLVTVRDRGIGLSVGEDQALAFPTGIDDALLGVGLPSIRGLTTDVRWREAEGGGTSVEMTFSTDPLMRQGHGSGLDALAPVAPASGALGNTIEVAIAPLAVACRVLPRLLRVSATRAHFPLDRHREAQRVLTTLLVDAAASWARADCVLAGLAAEVGVVELAIGPTTQTDAARLADAVAQIEPRASVVGPPENGQRLLLRFAR
jgi:serine/threonine-protein kinase RsbW